MDDGGHRRTAADVSSMCHDRCTRLALRDVQSATADSVDELRRRRAPGSPAERREAAASLVTTVWVLTSERATAGPRRTGRCSAAAPYSQQPFVLQPPSVDPFGAHIWIQTKYQPCPYVDTSSERRGTFGLPCCQP